MTHQWRIRAAAVCGAEPPELFHVVCAGREAARRYGGPVNNGDISVTWKLMRERGWKSNGTVREKINELMHYGFVVCTRKGGLGMGPDLFALTFFAIDECDGKLHVKPTKVAPNDWIEPKPKWQRPKRKHTAKILPYRKREISVPPDGTSGP